MSNTNKEVQTIKEELGQLGTSQTLNESVSRGITEIRAVASEIEPQIMEAYQKDLEHLEAGQIQLFLYHMAEREIDRRRLEQLPEEVADRVLFAVNDWRWWGDKFAQVAVGALTVAAGTYLMPYLSGQTADGGIPGTESNPFSDSAAAVPPRPRRKEGSSVVPFDRQAS